MKELVNLLIKMNKTISTMESCTGGGISNAITNIPDASKVFNFSAITYSNDYKKKMGVAPKIIDKYTVYSVETSCAMAKAISDYTESSYGVGVTGKLKKFDENNPYGEDDVVYLSVYDREKNEYHNKKIKLHYEERCDNKKEIIDNFVSLMMEIIC